jgi:hypothetical protein
MLFKNGRDLVSREELAKISRDNLKTKIDAMLACIEVEREDGLDGIYLHCLEVIYILYRLEAARRGEKWEVIARRSMDQMEFDGLNKGRTD